MTKNLENMACENDLKTVRSTEQVTPSRSYMMPNPTKVLNPISFLYSAQLNATYIVTKC